MSRDVCLVVRTKSSQAENDRDERLLRDGAGATAEPRGYVAIDADSDAVVASQGGTACTRRLLRQPQDSAFLSDAFCFLREHIEAFVTAALSVKEEVVAEKDVSNVKAEQRRDSIEKVANSDGQSASAPSSAGSSSSSSSIGRVGLRCVHCAWRTKKDGRVRGGLFFPKSVRLVRQAVRNFQRFHFQDCEDIPNDVKAEFMSLKETGSRPRSSKHATTYWEECCWAMGMFDAEDGIRLRTGYFVGEEREPSSAFSLGAENETELESFDSNNEKETSNADERLLSIAADQICMGTTTRPKRSTVAAPNRAYDAETQSTQSSSVLSMYGGGNELAKGCGRVVDVNSHWAKDSCLLSQQDDSKFLSKLFCFIRRHIEAFSIGDGDADGGPAANSGRVGLRCAHCCATRETPRSKSAILFPRSIKLVYQAARNWQRYHLLACPDIPGDVKAEYIALKGGKRSQSRRDAPKYWEECCQRMGMVDAEGGIVLRTGVFEDANIFGESSRFDESTVQAPVVSVKSLAAAVASKSGFSSDEGGFAEGPSQSNDLDQSNMDATLSCQKTAATRAIAETIAGTPLPSIDPLSPGGEHDALWDERIAQDLGNILGVDEQLKTEISYHASTDISESSSSSERKAPTAAHNDKLCINTSETPNHYATSTLPPEQWNDDMLEEIDFDDIFADADTNNSSSGLSANEIVLKKVLLALSLTGSVRHLSPSNLSFLGSKFYELFSGMSPYGEDRDGSDNEEEEDANGTGHENEGRHQEGRRKRERRRDSPNFTPLSELGFPPAICSIVSSLLGSGSCCSKYDSIVQVEEDLQLMVSKPDKFLFYAATGDLQIAEDTLYGREEETAKLLEAYNHVTDHSSTQSKEMVLLSGHMGVGKSVLVENVRSRFVERGACFVSGKYDVMQQLSPLSAIVSAIDDYCDLLARDPSRIQEVRDVFISAIGNEGSAVIARLIPSFNKIVPATDERVNSMTHVGGREELQRLAFSIRLLFRLTCSRDNPVVLYLDDIQWADAVSLKLLRALVTDTVIEGLLFIGCYRDNEVGVNHPVSSNLADIRGMGVVNVSPIHVGNLDIKCTKSLLSETLLLPPHMTQSLAEVVLQKTGGNALFAKQFIASLYDENLLRFSLSSRRWEWDIAKIRDKRMADSVAELMKAKLQKMEPDILDAIKLAAAFGAENQEALLQILDREPGRVGSTTAALDVAVTEGIISKVGSSYRFAHDQLQQAAYQAIPEAGRAAFHLQCGQSLWKWCNKDEAEKFLFVIVDQLHRGSSLITDHDEELALARLSLMAAEMATTMSAFLPALSYLTAGISMIREEDWHCHRQLCFDLYNLCAETEYILGDVDAVQVHLELLLAKGERVNEKMRAYYIHVQSTYARGKAMDAINTASSILAQMGETLPVVATEATVKQEIKTTERLLQKETEHSLMQLKAMEDKEKQEALKYLSLLCLFTIAEKKSYFPIPVCRMVRMSILHGVGRESAYAFACYGMILCGVPEKRSEGSRFGVLALSLLDKFQAMEQLPRVHSTVYMAIKPWTEPIQACVLPLKRAVDVGLTTGDIQYAMLCAHSYAGIALVSGHSLGPLMDEMRTQSKQMVEYNQMSLHTLGKPCRQTALNLLGRSADPTKLVGEEMDEDSLIDCLEGSEHVAFLMYSFRIWLEYLFGKYHQAWCTREKSNKEKSSAASGSFFLFPALCTNVFYSGLTALALARGEGKAEYEETINETMAQMKDWATVAPWNCKNKLALMQAEYAFLGGDLVSAATLYESAAVLAADHRFVHEQALALERSGMFHLETGDHPTASRLFTRARDCYKQWGARRKVAHVEECYL